MTSPASGPSSASATSLTGRVAVVTGAARGVGRTVAVALARAGADVVIAGRSTLERPNAVLSGSLEETAAAIHALGREALVVPADISRDDDIERLRVETLDRFGRCDILVNNAAVSFGGSFEDVTVSRWRKLLEVNLLAPIALIQQFLPALRESQGVAVAYSSRAAVSDEFKILGYAVSKSALERLTTGLAAESLGVRFVTLRIDDVVPTEAVEFHGGPIRDDALTVEDVADATLWLVEHAAEHDGETVSLLDLHARQHSR